MKTENKAKDLLTKMELLDSEEENDLTLNDVWEDIKKFLREIK